MESARKLFDEVPKRDVTWNAMIADYVLCASNEQALQMFDEMRNLGEKPDERFGRRAINFALLEMGSGDMSIVLGNALIDMYYGG
ncbi:hypothetical protein FF1_023605 [Malus domestica]